MVTKTRFLLCLVLLLGLTSCSGSKKQPDSSTQNPSPVPVEVETPAPSSKQPEESNTPTPPEVVAKSPDVPKIDKPAKTESKPNPPEKAPEVKEPEKLPPLSEESKEIVSNITDEVSEESKVVTENTGLITMNRLLLAQQAQWLLSGSFSTDFKALEPNLPEETNEYKFEITQGNDQEAIVVAIAKNDKLPSFTGASYAIPSGLPTSGLCQTKLPSQTTPTPPKLTGTDMSCGNDGVLVTD